MKINKDFKSLIPPLSKSEYELLKKSILEEGCRDAFVTWNGILVDGHNRYDICKKHNIKFNTVEKKFENEKGVKLWILDNQIGRRNLNKYQRAELALKQKEIISNQAKEHQKLSKGHGKKGLSNLTNLNTREIIAKKAGVASGTIYRVEKIIEKASSIQKKKLVDGELSIDEVFKTINKQPKSIKSKSVIQTKPIPENLIKSICDLIDKKYSSLENIEIKMIKGKNGWKSNGVTKEILENSMKQKLLSFIDKYYIGGEIESTVWEVSDNILWTKFITGDKSMIGDVKTDNFTSCLMNGDQIGVLTTSQLIKFLKTLEDDITIKSNKIKNEDEVKIVSLDFIDTASTVTYMLSDLSVIQRSKGLKQEPTYDLSFNLDTSFIEKYLKTKKAIPETKIFTILPDNEKKHKIVLGYSQVNTNRIGINIEATIKKKIDRPISFNAMYFYQMLLVNKDAEKITLKISDEGLAHVNVIDSDYEANYYLVEAETDP